MLFSWNLTGCAMWFLLYTYKKSVETPRHPFHESRPSHCPVQLNEQRKSPRRYVKAQYSPFCCVVRTFLAYVRRKCGYMPYQQKGCACIHIPRTSTVAMFVTVPESCEVSIRQEQSVSSKRLYCNVAIPRVPSLLSRHSAADLRLLAFRHGVGCLLAAGAVAPAFGAVVPSGEDKIRVNLSAKIVIYFFAANVFALKMNFST